jgi:hypothetical protein
MKMTKSEEISNPNSCLNKAAGDELVFVLRAKDSCAADTVRAWVTYRLKSGKNEPDDWKIIEAVAWANEVGRLHGVVDMDGPCGHCDTCGSPCDDGGCTRDRGHNIAPA